MIDLNELRHRIGGAVYAGGREWIGPGPGHSRRDASLHVSVIDGRAVWHSFTADGHDAIKAHLGLHDADYRPLSRKAADGARRARESLQQREARQHVRFCSVAWQDGVVLSDTPAAQYLGQRGLSDTSSDVLAFHPRMPRGYDSKSVGPAMLACVQSADGTPCGLHATFIKPDGSGKAGDRSRLMFGVTKACAVRLAPIHSGALAVAEGIETALSYAALTGIPTWAALSAGNLAAFVPPPGVETLTIAADGDSAGLEAARSLAEAARRRCNVVLDAAPDGKDWNDVLLEAGQ